MCTQNYVYYICLYWFNSFDNITIARNVFHVFKICKWSKQTEHVEMLMITEKNTFQHTHSKLPVHTSKDNIIKNPMEE